MVTASPLDVLMTLGEFNMLFQMVLVASLGSHRKVLNVSGDHHREVRLALLPGGTGRGRIALSMTHIYMIFYRTRVGRRVKIT